MYALDLDFRRGSSETEFKKLQEFSFEYAKIRIEYIMSIAEKTYDSITALKTWCEGVSFDIPFIGAKRVKEYVGHYGEMFKPMFSKSSNVNGWRESGVYENSYLIKHNTNLTLSIGVNYEDGYMHLETDGYRTQAEEVLSSYLKSRLLEEISGYSEKMLMGKYNRNHYGKDKYNKLYKLFKFNDMLFRLIFENGVVVDAKPPAGNYGIGYDGMDWLYDIIDRTIQ